MVPVRVAEAGTKWLDGLVQGFRVDLLRFLRARLANKWDAEDLAQEVYLRLLRVEGAGHVRNHRAYALRVAAHVAYEWNHLARNRLPHSSKALEGLPDGYEPLQALFVKQEIATLEKALDSLGPKCRAVVLLHRRDRLTYKEISTHLSISVSMVRKYLAQGLAVCQSQLMQGAQKVQDHD